MQSVWLLSQEKVVGKAFLSFNWYNRHIINQLWVLTGGFLSLFTSIGAQLWLMTSPSEIATLLPMKFHTLYAASLLHVKHESNITLGRMMKVTAKPFAQYGGRASIRNTRNEPSKCGSHEDHSVLKWSLSLIFFLTLDRKWAISLRWFMGHMSHSLWWFHTGSSVVRCESWNRKPCSSNQYFSPKL